MSSSTTGDIAQALAGAQKRGVKIRVLRDKSQSANKHDENHFLKTQGVDVEIRTGKGRGIMHHKFAIFDEKEILTGSYNWTQNAEKFNYENAIFTDEIPVVTAFEKEFKKLWDIPLIGKN